MDCSEIRSRWTSSTCETSHRATTLCSASSTRPRTCTLPFASHHGPRKPSDTFKAFRTVWITPFGAPLILRTDPDGSWGGEFAEQLDAIGCFFDPVPPEAHRIGSIERHNHLLRIIIEKLVESQGCVTEEHFDNIIAAATFAKNSGTWSSGRPPYVAAFGRVPRVGLDFINDPHSLTAGGTLGEAQQQAALLRAEAMKTIAETSASAAFRRTILRKTNNENTDNLEPGALVAYWRWTVRSHRKRGGYRMARYIGRDPDRSLWVQTGTNTVKVAPNQVRRALGYESWTPSPEDMATLRQARGEPPQRREHRRRDTTSCTTIRRDGGPRRPLCSGHASTS